ncbi:MAG: WxL domain-containing protein [Actinomycetota bacterium]|nr:WxL domain-containing protein [Actinomycetota bacterium]
MKNLKVVAATAALGIGLVLPAGAAAQTDDTQITLAAGQLSYPTPFSAGNFPNTSLTGLQQTARASVNPWKVTDARGGLLNGWNVTVAASRFTDTVDATKRLPAGSLALTNTPTTSTTAGNTSLPPAALPVAAALDGGTTQKLATAALAQGLGEWTFTPGNVGGGDLVLTVPPNAQPGTYVSTITTTLATGP